MDKYGYEGWFFLMQTHESGPTPIMWNPNLPFDRSFAQCLSETAHDPCSKTIYWEEINGWPPGLGLLLLELYGSENVELNNDEKIVLTEPFFVTLDWGAFSNKKYRITIEKLEE